MAQHDGIISNDTGANVRSDINNALSAIFTTHSGATEPSTTYAYQLWMDTANNVLKMRNSANSAWYTLPISPVANNTVDINGGTIDGVTLGASSAITSAVITTADINGGTIDGVTIGGSSAGAITGTTITGTSFVTSGDMTFGDNDKAIFGAGSDLQIYHDGSKSIINDAGTGNLEMQVGGSTKLATTSTGIDVTGTVTADGLTVDDGTILIKSLNDTGNSSPPTIKFEDTDISQAAGQKAGQIEFYTSDASPGPAGVYAYVNAQAENTNGLGALYFGTGQSGSAENRLSIGSGGDISFYEDTGTTAKFFWDASTENLGIGTSSPSGKLNVVGSNLNLQLRDEVSDHVDFASRSASSSYGGFIFKGIRNSDGSTAERMRIDSSGNVLVGKTSNDSSVGCALESNGQGYFVRSGNPPLSVNRLTNDGKLVRFYQATVEEGDISVSGSTVSYNGGHLSRWSQLPDSSKDETIVKGTVMTNLDAMCEWSHEAVEAQEAVYDEEGNLVSEAVEAKEAYIEDNEQLNRMAVSSVEGDTNVAGVFVNWDNDDDQFNDMNIAMTGDMVIRIAQGVTVNRGDLLMSAGDGTAKPQEDDIVRSKTIAKVTSTHVSHTYDDGSYLVPCVLMAC